MARNSSVHAAGVIIAPGDLRDYVPLATTATGEVTTQLEMKSLESIGLLKLDVLGLRTVTVLDNAVDMVRRRGADLHLDRIPLDDPETLQLLSRGDTVGVFQLESSGMREALRRIAVSEFDDITAIVSIYRPGSMDMLDLYAMNKHSSSIPKDDLRNRHPVLRDVLDDTHGVMIYQEQVMEIAHRLAGMDLGDADILRRAMSKKIHDVMIEQRTRFIDGATRNGVERSLAATIFDLVEKFAGYGFNKSHAVSYALLAYQTAYLKAHHAAEFMAASLSSEIGRIDRLSELVEECARLGMTVNSPSVNRSHARFEVDEEGGIIYALSAIKNVGEGPSNAIVEERQGEEGPFRDIFDLCARLDSRCMNRKVLQSLVEAGALDCLPGNRGQLLEVLDDAIDYGSRLRRLREAGQMSLFSAGDSEAAMPETPILPDVPDIPVESRLESERSLLGFYLSGHPLDQYSEELRSFTTASPGALPGKPGQPVTIGGIVSSRRDATTRKGEPVCFVSIEGREGSSEAVAFSEALSRYRDLLSPGRFVLIDGETSRRRNGRGGQGDGSMVISRVIDLQDCRRVLNAGVHLLLRQADIDRDRLEHAVELMRKHPGTGAVTALIEHGSGRSMMAMSRSLRVEPGNRLIRDLRSILGGDSVVLRRGREMKR